MLYKDIYDHFWKITFSCLHKEKKCYWSTTSGHQLWLYCLSLGHVAHLSLSLSLTPDSLYYKHRCVNCKDWWSLNRLWCRHVAPTCWASQADPLCLEQTSTPRARKARYILQQMHRFYKTTPQGDISGPTCQDEIKIIKLLCGSVNISDRNLISLTGIGAFSYLIHFNHRN